MNDKVQGKHDTRFLVLDDPSTPCVAGYVCLTCSALVVDCHAHDAWHHRVIMGHTEVSAVLVIGKKVS